MTPGTAYYLKTYGAPKWFDFGQPASKPTPATPPDTASRFAALEARSRPPALASCRRHRRERSPSLASRRRASTPGRQALARAQAATFAAEQRAQLDAAHRIRPTRWASRQPRASAVRAAADADAAARKKVMDEVFRKLTPKPAT